MIVINRPPRPLTIARTDKNKPGDEHVTNCDQQHVKLYALRLTFRQHAFIMLYMDRWTKEFAGSYLITTAGGNLYNAVRVEGQGWQLRVWEPENDDWCWGQTYRTFTDIRTALVAELTCSATSA